ncbi:MAG: MarR family transcriptional regulator [Tissierellia bacterium]|nr:MarR family transcriptional regulator [Tissierellia bacterium]
MKNIEITKNITESDKMLANLDRVMRQLRRRPQGTGHTNRGTYRLLRIIAESPGISTKELSEVLDIRRASLNEKLLSLEIEGMISRDRDLKDQRVYVVNLEKVAMDYLAKGKEIRSKIHDSISEILSPEEIGQLESLAGKLADGLELVDTGGEADGKSETQEGSI